MARRSTRGRFVRPAPKTKIWVGAGIAQFAVATNGKTLITSLNAGALALRPFTILRTRLLVTLDSDQIVASENPTGAYGEIVVKEIATGIGVTAVPGPLTDPDADWYIYQGMTARLRFVTAAGFESNSGAHWEIDSKAMRKVGPTDDVAVCFEMRNVGGGTMNLEGRQLIQLH